VREHGLNMRMTITVALFVLATLPPIAYAQEKPLSPEARRLSDALTELKAHPDDSTAQERYLETFPRTYKDFLNLFGYHHELYDGHEFIDLLPLLADRHETEVGSLLVQLSKDAEKEADAPTYLQQATAIYASHYTKTFATLVNQLTRKQRMSLVDFLADVENHSAYKDYQETIDHLKSLGQNRLANEFEVARKKRSQQPHG